MPEHNFKPKTTIGNTGNVKNKAEAKNTQEKLEKFYTFCAENGNPIVIIDSGQNLDSENSKVNPGVLKELDEGDKIFAEFLLKYSKEYLNGITFTDDFHEDNYKRREWEYRVKKEIDEDSLKYYNSNRLAFNNTSSVISNLDEVLEQIKDSEIKNQLLDIKKEIPKELIREEGKLDIPYYSLEENEEIEVVKKFAKVAQKIVSILE